MPSRQESIIDVVASEVTRALKGVLAERISQYYSEAEWDAIATQTVQELRPRLADSVSLMALASAGDLKDPAGKVNLPGILEALQCLQEQQQRNPGPYAKLKFLIEHTRHLFEKL